MNCHGNARENHADVKPAWRATIFGTPPTRRSRPLDTAPPWLSKPRQLAALPVALALASACAAAPPATPARIVGISDPPPEVAHGPPLTLSFERADGQTRDVTTLRGRAVLIVAARMDDLRSQAYVHSVERIARAHPDDLSVFVMLGDDYPHNQMAVLATSYARVMELQRSEVVLADAATRAGETQLGAIDRVPTTFLVNRAGVVSRRVEGLLTPSQLFDLVRPALPPGRETP